MTDLLIFWSPSYVDMKDVVAINIPTQNSHNTSFSEDVLLLLPPYLVLQRVSK